MDTPNKHAYLVIAHSNPYVLEKLLLLLDDKRNDVFIHIDKKVKNFDFVHYENLMKKSKIQFIDRMDVRWGHVSLVAVELNLMRVAYSKEEYSYFHLISGSDLPLKSQNMIHDFFENNAGREFIGFGNDSFNDERITKMHLFPKYMRVDGTVLWQRAFRFLRNNFLGLQRDINYNFRDIRGVKYVYGSQWVSMTRDLVCDLLKNEKYFLRFYKYANCADEIYKQTFVYNSKYKDKIYDEIDELNGSQRFMDWQRGRPYTFREGDYDLVINSGLLFARKFEDQTDRKIVDLIFNHVKSLS